LQGTYVVILMNSVVMIPGGAPGHSTAEAGGPGITYLQGDLPVYKNLRIDNKCQKAKVCNHLKSFWVSPS